MTTQTHPAAPFDPFAGPAISLGFPTTEAQREIWAASQLDRDGSLAYNEAVTIALTGPLDRVALDAAVSSLCARHESLRGTVSPDGLTMLVAEPGPATIPLTDLAALDAATREARRLALHQAAVRDPFDLARGPLVRFALVRLGHERYELLITAHHIICDGWSFGVLASDLAALYAMHSRGAAMLPPAPRFSQYAADLASAQSSEARRDDERYWRTRFSGPLPVLELPLDRARPLRRTFDSAREDLRLSSEQLRALRATAAAHGTSLFVVLFSGFATLLHRLTGQDDLVIGVPSAGQAASGEPGLVGHCVNTLPIRVQLAAEMPAAALLTQVRNSMFDAAEHQGLGFGSLLARLPIPRDPARSPLVSVLFNLDRPTPPAALAFSGLGAQMANVPRAYEQFELFLNALETEDGVQLECQYHTALFDATTVRRWLRAYARLLDGLAVDAQAPVCAIPMLTDEDAAILSRCNETALEVDTEARVPDLIAAQVSRTPAAAAIEHDGEALTYAELDVRANRLAHVLRAHGARRGALVGLCLERTPDLVVAVLAALRTGAGYVPLDPGYPKDRLTWMAQDADLAVLVTDAHLATALALPARAVVRIDVERDVIAGAPSSPLPSRDALSATAEDPAYVIYTSGSTGRPKGVLVPHRAVVNLLSSVQREPGMSADDVVLAVTTLSFDIAVSELLLPLTVGARIVLASREQAADGEALRTLVESRGITFIDATPATYRLLLAAGWRGGPSVRLICTGEAMPRDLAQVLVHCAGAVWNGYGPTETTVWSTFARVTAPVDRIRIGRPVANSVVRIVDALGQQVPVGVPGELLIGGRGVAIGYLNRPDLTAERFITDAAAPPTRWYRTGDLVRLLPTGELECLGRTDAQVKVRGFRIEPGEIEAVLTQHDAVEAACVIAREDRPGDVRLVAYVVTRQGHDLPDDLRSSVRRALPEYMVPNLFVRMAALPLTPSGKVDRRALPAPDADAVTPASTAFVAPTTPTETILAALWAEALGVGQVSIHDDFFALGGHSLLASQVLARLRRDHGVQVPFRTVFEAPTVHRLAAHVDAQRPATPDGVTATAVADAAIPATGASRAPLSVLQERVWLLEELQQSQAFAHAHSASWLLRGDMDADRLERAIREVVGRHSVLRTRFEIADGERCQVVEPTTAFSLARRDFSALPPAAQHLALHEFFRGQQLTPFDLSTAPLFRAVLIRLRDGEHLLYTIQHGMIWDGWSFDLFLHDLTACYAGSGTSLPAIAVTYGDFAAWQASWLAGEEAARQRAFWQQQLAGDLRELVIPADRPRPRVSCLAGEQVTLRFTTAEVEQLRAVAREYDATLYMVCLAAWNALLHRYSGETDLLVGSPVRARTRPELEHVIGPFVNTVLLRTHVRAELPFAELLASIRHTTLDAFSHQELPFEELGVRVPPVRVLFSMQDARERPVSLGDLGLSQHHVPQFSATNDMMLWMMDAQDGMLAVLNFSTELFDRSSAELMLAQLRALLVGVVARPEAPVGAYDLAVPGVVPAPVRAVAAPEGGPSRVDDVIAHWVREAPDRVALRDGRLTLTYAGLELAATRVASALANRPDLCGGTVAIMLRRGADRTSAALGVLRVGAAVLFVDPSAPAAYRHAALAAAGATLVLADAPVDAGIPCLRLDELPAGAETVPRVAVSPDASAVVLAVPGPRAVEAHVVSHRQLLAQLHGLAQPLALSPADVVMPVASSDVPWAFLATLLPLAAGGTLVVPTDDMCDEPRDLADALDELSVSVLLAPEETWRGLLTMPWRAPSTFRGVLPVQGIEPEFIGTVGSRVPRVVTLLGTVQDGGASAAHVVTVDDGGPCAGVPLGTEALRVVDPAGRDVETGLPGTLVMQSALGSVPVAARARRTADGRLRLMDTRTEWLWLDGAAVAREAIGAAIASHESVQAAAVTVHRDATGAPRLVAYVVAADGHRVPEADVRAAVRRVLPRSCVPQRIVVVGALPHRADGRVAHEQLPTPFVSVRHEATVVLPRNDAERVLAAAWCHVLGMEQVSVTDNFFQLGGTSLLCFRVVDQVRRTAGQVLSPRALLVGTLEQAAAGMVASTAPATPSVHSGVLSRLKGIISGAAS